MSSIEDQLEKLWSTPEESREKGLNLLFKILNNIKNNPNNDKYKSMNMTKIRQKFKKYECPAALYFLFSCGFKQDPFDSSKLKLEPHQGMKMLQEGLQKLNTFIKNKKNPPKPKEEEKDLDDEDIEMQKALKMSMDENTDDKMDVDKKDSKDTSDNKDTTKKEEDDPWSDLSPEDRELFKNLKAAKGIKTQLKSSDLVGLSKEEKLQKVKELQEKFRKEKKKSEVKQKLEKERRRRENTRMAMETQRKRKEYDRQMMAKRKRRDKDDERKRKERIRQKIKEDKERKKLQEKYRKEALEREKLRQEELKKTKLPPKE